MILTSSHNISEEILKQLEYLQSEPFFTYVPRRDRSIRQMMKDYNSEIILVVTEDGLKLYGLHWDQPFFFHPSSAVFRIKRLKHGDNDTMVESCQLQTGDTFLDCTLGLGSDSIVASYVVGEQGKVTGIESERWIAYLVQYGIHHWKDGSQELISAMKRLKVVWSDHLSYLKQLPDHSFDIVYFDPMFRQPVYSSSGISPLRQLANKEKIDINAINEAKRVAKKRVVIKERKNSGELNRLGFTPVTKGKVTFGVIQL
ncbi:class I SAM-dependent methyltransferase [Microaerobacter geothermalis]|uniref:class I SAM-dependent methyltransferase n=1 Tax=Microaerobacter geothermalis TaxID=674972 RepID=UPI001F2F9624|nr:class I SAM-dependent methyltransferase [Microaerobacter geothermalis]MCF6093128.1 class I SAM-dependent methyltransferase [Microaerobacter geothermalis]